MGSPLEDLKQPFLVVINGVYQIYGVIDKSLLDHIVQEGVARERWGGVDL